MTDALNKTSLLDKSGQHPLDLSAAERRFLAIASVLAMAPRVLLLDEAQRGLDRVWTRRLEDILATERLAGKSIVMICHDMDFVELNADTVLALGGLTPSQIPVPDFFPARGFSPRYPWSARPSIVSESSSPKAVRRGDRPVPDRERLYFAKT